MSKINKIDYYAGAFLTSLLKSAKSVPAIFEETDTSRRLQITTDLNEFNIYIKYSGKQHIAKVGGRTKRSWYVRFTEAEFRKLKTEFAQAGCENFVVLVLTNRNFTETRIAVIDYHSALKCLSKTTDKGHRRINVVRYGKEHKFVCYGATESEEEGFQIFINHMRYFDKFENGEGED